MPHQLSKSRFLSGLQCRKKLWIETHNRDLIPPPSPVDQHKFQQGQQVGELAREEFPDGVFIEADHFHIPEAISQTELAMENNVTALFEGAFLADGVLVRPDILRHDGDGAWQLIEVKSTTRVKEEHIPDIAIQQYVIDRAGHNIDSSHLMHINTDCVYPDLANLFSIEEVTAEVNEFIPHIPEIIQGNSTH